MALAERFAVNLKKARQRKKLSQAVLAEKAGYTTSAISMLERGVRSAPLDGIERLAKALGTNPIALLS
jgi:transcriptional regulator with XRE-family HTH domain